MISWKKLFLIIILLLPFSKVWASGINLPQKSGTFSIIPARQEISLSAGQSKKIYLRLVNHLGQDQDFSFRIKNAVPERYGSSGFVLATTTNPDFYNFSQIAQLDISHKIVAQGQEIQIPVTISVPAGWPPQSIPGVIMISPENGKGGANTRVKTNAGVFILIRVSGEAKEEGSIEKYGLLGSKYVALGEPIHLQIAYKNSGNVHLNPYGAIYLKNIFGKKVHSQFIDSWFVLPQSVRLREIVLPNRLWPGIYHSDLLLNLGYEDKLVSDSIYFFVIPNWWQSLIVATLLMFLLRAVLKWRERKQNV